MLEIGATINAERQLVAAARCTHETDKNRKPNSLVIMQRRERERVGKFQVEQISILNESFKCWKCLFGTGRSSRSLKALRTARWLQN